MRMILRGDPWASTASGTTSRVPTAVDMNARRFATASPRQYNANQSILRFHVGISRRARVSGFGGGFSRLRWVEPRPYQQAACSDSMVGAAKSGTWEVCSSARGAALRQRVKCALGAAGTGFHRTISRKLRTAYIVDLIAIAHQMRCSRCFGLSAQKNPGDYSHRKADCARDVQVGANLSFHGSLLCEAYVVQNTWKHTGNLTEHETKAAYSYSYVTFAGPY